MRAEILGWMFFAWMMAVIGILKLCGMNDDDACDGNTNYFDYL